jgi:hypothetical protein
MEERSVGKGDEKGQQIWLSKHLKKKKYIKKRMKEKEGAKLFPPPKVLTRDEGKALTWRAKVSHKGERREIEPIW